MPAIVPERAGKTMSESILRDAVVRLPDYQSGLSEAEVRARTGVERVVKLDSNENPLGASAAALAAAGRTSEAEPVIKDVYRVDPGFSLDAFASTQPYKDTGTLDHLLADRAGCFQVLLGLLEFFLEVGIQAAPGQPVQRTESESLAAVETLPQAGKKAGLAVS